MKLKLFSLMGRMSLDAENVSNSRHLKGFWLGGKDTSQNGVVTTKEPDCA